MGFGWSSYVAQNFMVTTCVDAGFSKDQLLTEEGRFFDQHTGAVSICTDDVIHFLRATEEERNALQASPLDALDETWLAKGVRGNARKSFDLLPDAVALGIELKDGLRLLPKGSRVCDLLRAGIDLLHGATARPRELSSLGGILQWHDLMNRPLFSCLHRYCCSRTRRPCGQCPAE